MNGSQQELQAAPEDVGLLPGVTHVHGEDAARDELSVLPDGEVPRLDPHQIVEGELQYQTPFRTNLDRDKRLVSPDLFFFPRHS